MARSDDIDADHAEANLRSAIIGAIEVTEQRDAAEFDGLQGPPPDWLVRDDGRWKAWRAARTFMLDKYPEPYIHAWIAERQGYDVPAIPGYDSLPEHRQEIEHHLSVLQKVWIEWTASGRKGAAKAQKGKQAAKATKESALNDALDTLFSEQPSFPKRAIEISLEWASKPAHYFEGGLIPYRGKGKGFRKFAALQDKIREALKLLK